MAICIKIKYSNRWAAARAVQAIVLERGQNKQKIPVAIYPCTGCHAWHLTSQKMKGKSRKWNVLMP